MTEEQAGRAGGRKGCGPRGGRSRGRGRGRQAPKGEGNTNETTASGATADNQEANARGQPDGGAGRDERVGRGRGERGGRGRSERGGRGHGERGGRGHGERGGRGRGRGRGGPRGRDKAESKKKSNEDPTADEPTTDAGGKTSSSSKNANANKGKAQKEKPNDPKKQDETKAESKGEKNGQDQKPTNESKKKNFAPNKNKKKDSNKRDDKSQNSQKGKKSKSKSNDAGETDQQKVSPYALVVPPSENQQTNDINYKRGETITVLHVAEKPSIAQAIAKGLSDGNYNSGGGKGMPVLEFTNPPFPKAPHTSKCKHKVTSVAGHVFSVDFHAKFQSWDSVDPAELFDAPIVKKPTSMGVIKNLEAGARGADFIVLWMDCDREGENINFEVLDCCMHLMQSGGTKSNFDRVCK